MFFIIMALVIGIAIALAFVIRAVILSARKDKRETPSLPRTDLGNVEVEETTPALPKSIRSQPLYKIFEETDNFDYRCLKEPWNVDEPDVFDNLDDALASYYERLTINQKKQTFVHLVIFTQFTFGRHLTWRSVRYWYQDDSYFSPLRKKPHHSKKPYRGCLCKEEYIRGLVGIKRLVDETGRTKAIPSLYEISDDESHYQCKKYKFDRREARRNKRAMRESFVAEW